MEHSKILWLFLIIRLSQHLIERSLTRLNKNYYEKSAHREDAAKILNISDEDMNKALSYSRDRFQYGLYSTWSDLLIMLIFITMGGLGFLENYSLKISESFAAKEIVTGLIFFGLLSIGSMILTFPFEIYYTFVLEAKHGFNRQSIKDFFVDKAKETIISAIMGGILLSLIFYIMSSLGTYWWLTAWITVFGFSLFTAWIYPSVLAPLFNKFSPLEEGELKNGIINLANKVDFNASEIFIMDASKRSTHGNAYFTGILGKKKIVLFDNLIQSMLPHEILAVLAHELGHFKLNHIRWRLVLSFFMMGGIFYLLSLTIGLNQFYEAFSLTPTTNYGALLVFSLWFGPLNFFLMPFSSYLSRRHEFSADKFALKQIDDKQSLSSALLKLRETSHLMPINHPWFSAFYLSHPPLLERLKELKKNS